MCEQRRRPAGGVSLADHPKVRGFSWPFMVVFAMARMATLTMAAANVQADHEC
jgi:hypothetical protein